MFPLRSIDGVPGRWEQLFRRHGLYASRDCRRTLSVIDDSGDGEVSPRELTQGFRRLGLVLHPKLVTALFVRPFRVVPFCFNFIISSHYD